MTGGWPVAVATHAARDAIGSAPGPDQRWRSLEQWLDWVAEAGFDGVDLSSSVFPLERSDAWWHGIGMLAADRGLRLASINCLRSSLADVDYWHLGDQRIRRAVQIGHLLDIPTVNISLAVPAERLDVNAHRQQQSPPGSSRVATEAERQATRDRLAAIRDVTPAGGPALVVELHHGSLVDTAGSLLSLALDLGIAVNPDLVNELWAFDRIEASWQTSLEMLAPVSGGVWHVKNCRRRKREAGVVFEDAPLDVGDIDYRAAIAVMAESGFEGWISIERSNVGDFVSTATRGLAFIRSLHTIDGGGNTP